MERSFRINDIPDFECPTCKKGLLKKLNSFKMEESAASSTYHSSESTYNSPWRDGVFCGILQCNNGKCKESVSISGKYETIEDITFDEQSQNYFTGYTDQLTPRLFIPAINCFPLHDDIPQRIAESITDSFVFFWLDLDACANKIRIVVELILDQQKVKKYEMSKESRKKIVLHKRIEEFKEKRPDEANLLMSIKWIGNAGSHNGKKLSAETISAAYLILKDLTYRLYSKEPTIVKQLSKRINKRKGPLKGSKR